MDINKGSIEHAAQYTGYDVQYLRIEREVAGFSILHTNRAYHWNGQWISLDWNGQQWIPTTEVIADWRRCYDDQEATWE